MVIPDWYSVYLFLVVVFASIANTYLFSMVIVAPCPRHREYDVIVGYQTTFALVQLILLGVLGPQTLFVDGCFIVAFHGPARYFYHDLQVLCFSALVVLATSNVTTTALSSTHRFLVVMGKKIHVLKMILILALSFVLHATVMVLVLATEDWSKLAPRILYNRRIQEAKPIAFNIKTPAGFFLMSLTLFCPPIVCVLAVILSFKGQTQLSRATDPIVRSMRFLHAKQLKVLRWQAIVPCFLEFVQLGWYRIVLESNQAVGRFECFYFGIAPNILLLQALIPLCSVFRYKRSVTYRLTGKVLAIVGLISAGLGISLYLSRHIRFL